MHSFSDLIAAARSGDRLVSFPTDTVPALAVRPERAALIFAAKQRSQTKPLILMGANSADLWEFTAGSAEEKQIWQQVAEQYWPGALTLVLPASSHLPAAVNPTDPTTIGIRVPNSAIARYILSQTGPLATTSANRSGEPPLQTMEAIAAQFPEVLTLPSSELDKLEQTLSPAKPSELDPATSQGVPSTVIRWQDNQWEILRQGSIQL
ncbi:L-threonylcarbamoyladenylate synthase [Leptolyngbya sp. FACHB-541]|uniref:L-threonylcarbamoyladenylate synthase n=1 Tax=Leptolyngbya sp. FACHB-541 TaxID=2692810 RepID=UPI001681F4A7|nr:L-threonylcarbamoyladenylate synthase [Leptolyngbya sp. FACHB-541]MBD2000932.1 L-threonylcarbamoyladenylate synthase [Leptolyngbya sp. FACHB-541]